jgi:hypothetical protein
VSQTTGVKGTTDKIVLTKSACLHLEMEISKNSIYKCKVHSTKL